MIRYATSADVPQIVKLGSRSLVDGPYAGLIEDNPEATYKLALSLIHGGGKVIVWDDDGKIGGVIAMLVVAHPFSGQVVADELMWYVEAEARKGGAGVKLLWEAERVARELGAKHFQVSAPNADVGKLYERYGFKKIETKYLKELK